MGPAVQEAGDRIPMLLVALPTTDRTSLFDGLPQRSLATLPSPIVLKNNFRQRLEETNQKAAEGGGAKRTAKQVGVRDSTRVNTLSLC